MKLKKFSLSVSLILILSIVCFNIINISKAEALDKTYISSGGDKAVLNINQNISLDTDTQMLSNPNRGFGPEIEICDTVKWDNVACTDSASDWNTYRYAEFFDVMNAFKGSDYINYDKPHTAYIRMIADSYTDKSSFDQAFIDRVNYVFELLRQYNVKAVFRLAFSWYKGDEPSVTNAEGLWKSLSSTLQTNKDDILTIQVGTICGWGEWTKGCANSRKADFGKIYRIVLDNTPKDITVEHQYTDFETPNWTQSDANRVGYHSDHFIGALNIGDSVTWKGLLMNDMKSKHLNTALNSMESWWGCNLYGGGYDKKSPLFEANSNNMALRFVNFAGRMAQTRTTVLDYTHSYLLDQLLGTGNPWGNLEQCNSPVTNPERFTLDRYKNKLLSVLNNRLTEGDFPYASSGNLISAFDYIRDYLGYRLKIMTGSLQTDNDKINVNISLKNYGFAQPFRMEAGFAVIDVKTNRIVSTHNLSDGQPQNWLPYSNYEANHGGGFDNCIPAIFGEWCQTFHSMKIKEPLVHNISTTFNLPTQAGQYYIGFYLKDLKSNYATFANDLLTVDGIKILDPSTVINVD
ncbi:MAG: DUF4874 domain-containing protein [Bifidobacteriaceae bacterium]|nr:DUF4874 domain-containing protein [Bifidobacteriaceae bacterium]